MGEDEGGREEGRKVVMGLFNTKYKSEKTRKRKYYIYETRTTKNSLRQFQITRRDPSPREVHENMKIHELTHRKLDHDVHKKTAINPLFILK